MLIFLATLGVRKQIFQSKSSLAQNRLFEILSLTLPVKSLFYLQLPMEI